MIQFLLVLFKGIPDLCDILPSRRLNILKTLRIYAINCKKFDLSQILFWNEVKFQFRIGRKTFFTIYIVRKVTHSSALQLTLEGPHKTFESSWGWEGSSVSYVVDLVVPLECFSELSWMCSKTNEKCQNQLLHSMTGRDSSLESM